MEDMIEDFKEKRLSARIKGEFNIKITESHESIVVNTIDLSSSGLRFKSQKNIPLFREIGLTLALPGKTEKHKESVFNCHAIVVRSEKSHVEEAFNIALTFIDVEEKDLKVLMKFLEDSVQKNKESNR